VVLRTKDSLRKVIGEAHRPYARMINFWGKQLRKKKTGRKGRGYKESKDDLGPCPRTPSNA